MTNQEAIERIEHHIIIHGAKEPHAVYITEALNMAIEALKAQGPRLLKADDFAEADGWGSIPAWYEHNPSLGIKTIDGWGIIKRENLQDKTTRYWTSRPTAEQRKAVEWE